MSTTQGNLFGAGPGINAYGTALPVRPSDFGTRELSRSTDPKSSKRAASWIVKTGKLRGSAKIVVAVLRRASRSLTYREIWQFCTDDERRELREQSAIAKRLPLLERRGIVRPGPERECTAGGAPSREWALTAQ